MLGQRNRQVQSQYQACTIYNLTFSQNSNEKGKLKFTKKIFLASQDSRWKEIKEYSNEYNIRDRTM